MMILEALHKHGAMSPTAIARVLGLDRSQVFRRMSDLEKNGLATPTGRVVKSPSNRNEREWMFVTGESNG
jgi:DNA-binding MarR family transcriptional regulator